MAAQQPVFFLDIEDMHLEVVLDNGFWSTFSRAADLHAHTYYELMLCPEGSIELALSDGTVIPMQAASFCLIPPRVYHRTLGDDASRKLAIRFFCTRNLRSGRIYGAFLAAMEENTAPVLDLGVQPALHALTRQLCEELQQPRLASDACVQNLLSLLLIELFRRLCSSDASAIPAPLPRQVTDRRLSIEEYLNRNYTRPLTEEDLAAEVHLSKRQLNRVLQQLYGMSFRQLLIDIRLSRAAELLGNTDTPASEVAALVGYTSVSGFYEAFHKRYGIAPGSYKSHRYE